MEDLQLALTAARVDQKNFGLWLRSWQVGQILQALVTDRSPSGELVLRVGGQQITATADIPVQKGAVLALEVSSLTPTPILKVLSTPTQQGSQIDPLSAQLQRLVTRQGNISAPFASLAQAAAGNSLLALLGLRGDILAPIIRSLAGLDELLDPKQLRGRVRDSGLFLEPRLSQLGQSAERPLVLDLKANLLRLLQRANAAIQNIDEGSAKPPQLLADRSLLSGFRQQLEGALATISLNQLISSSVTEDGGGNLWVVHLPFHTPEGIYNLSLRISQDRDAPDQPPEQDEWRVVLDLSLPKLGTIEAELYLRNRRLSVVIYSERADTARFMDEQLQGLRDGLHSRGLEVSILRSHSGTRSADLVANPMSPGVDEQA